MSFQSQPSKRSTGRSQSKADQSIEAAAEQFGRATKALFVTIFRAILVSARDSRSWKVGYLTALCSAAILSRWQQIYALYIAAAVVVIMVLRYALTHRSQFQMVRQAQAFFGKVFGEEAKRSLTTTFDDVQEPSIQRMTVKIPISFDATQTLAVEEEFGHWIPAEKTWKFDWDFFNKNLTITQAPPLPEIVQWDAKWASELPWHKVRIGMSDNEQMIDWDLLTTPNGLFTGPPGTGKSTVVNGLIATALERDWNVYACDPKETEFFWLDEIERSSVHVAFGYENCWELTIRAREELLRRKAIMRKHRARHFKDIMVELDMKPMLVVIDEVFDLFTAHTETDEEKAQKEACKNAVHSLSRLGRAIGVYVVLAAQRPDAKVIEGEMRNNFRSRLLLGRPSPQEIQMMLNISRPLVVNEMCVGRGFWQSIELPEPVVVQTAYAADEQLDAVVQRTITPEEQ